MCLAIPGKVIDLLDVDGIKMARVSFGGMVKQVCMEYTPHAVAGDYVLVHVGFALSTVDAEEAERTYQLLEELGHAQRERDSAKPEELSELDGGSAA